MYSRNFYKDLDRTKIKMDVEKEGYHPLVISNDAGFVYHEHQHPETKLLVCLEGNMKVWTQGKEYNFMPGDKLIIPGNTKHKAVVGKTGCTFFWSEKIVV